MAVKTKAVLVGAFEGNRLYYLLQPHGDKKSDGAVIAPDGRIEFVKFFHFITTTPQIEELKFSKFHKFLWNPGNSTNELDKWNRIFLKKTQLIDNEMLIGTTIVNELGAEELKGKNYSLRADEFRRSVASTGRNLMDTTIISRKSMPSMRTKIGRGGLGPLLGGKPNVDGDGDGFVDDGLPTMRPFIPGFDFILNSFGEPVLGKPEVNSPTNNTSRTSLRSIRTGRADTARDRGASSKELLSSVTDIEDYVATKHNNGKQIKKKADAIKVLSQLIPSFGLPMGDKSRSQIEFLDNLSDSSELQPWQSAYLNQFIFMIGEDPGRNEITWHVVRMREEFATEGTAGYTAPPKGNENYLIDMKFSDEGERFVPQRIRKPMMEIGYSAEDDAQNSRRYLASLMLKKDKRNYIVLTHAISAAMNKELLDNQRHMEIMAAMEYKYSGIDKSFEHIEKIIKKAKKSRNISMANELDKQMIQDIWGMINDAARAISSVDSNFDINTLLRKTRQALQGGTVDDVLKSVRKTIDGFNNSLNTTRIAPLVQFGENIIDKWLPVHAKNTGVHESAHALHNIRKLEEMRKKATILRDAYLERHIERKKQSGGSIPDMDILKKQLPIESFFTDVYKEDMKIYATSRPESFKQDILLWSTLGGGTPLLPPDEISVGTGSLFQRLSDSAIQLKDMISSTPFGFVQPIVQSIGIRGINTQQDVLDYISNIDAWLQQPIYNGTSPVLLNDYLAQLLNSINSRISGAREQLGVGAREYKAGENLTPAILALLTGENLLQREKSSNRNVFRGITIGKQPASTVLSTLGFPDIEDDNGEVIGGGLPADVRPIVDAIIGISPMMRRLGKPSPLPLLDLQKLLPSRTSPDEADLPSSFGGMSMSDFKEMTPEAAFELFSESIDRGLYDTVSSLSQGTLPGIVESYIGHSSWAMHELYPLDDDETQIMYEIARKIGLPAGIPQSRIASNLSSVPSSGYSSYQATLVPNHVAVSPDKWSIAEFIAESAVADIMGVPFSQIADSGEVTRGLTNQELQVLYKLINWIFAGRIPSDRINEVSYGYE